MILLVVDVCLHFRIEHRFTAWTRVDLTCEGVSKLFHQNHSLASCNGHHGQDWYWQNRQGCDEPAEENAPPGIGVGTAIVRGSLVVNQGKYPDYENQDRGNKDPTKLEYLMRFLSGHVFNVCTKAPCSINPNYSNCLKKCDIHQGDGSRVVVK